MPFLLDVLAPVNWRGLAIWMISLYAIINVVPIIPEFLPSIGGGENATHLFGRPIFGGQRPTPIQTDILAALAEVTSSAIPGVETAATPQPVGRHPVTSTLSFQATKTIFSLPRSATPFLAHRFFNSTTLIEPAHNDTFSHTFVQPPSMYIYLRAAILLYMQQLVLTNNARIFAGAGIVAVAAILKYRNFVDVKQLNKSQAPTLRDAKQEKASLVLEVSDLQSKLQVLDLILANMEGTISAQNQELEEMLKEKDALTVKVQENRISSKFDAARIAQLEKDLTDLYKKFSKSKKDYLECSDKHVMAVRGMAAQKWELQDLRKSVLHLEKKANSSTSDIEKAQATAKDFQVRLDDQISLKAKAETEANKSIKSLRERILLLENEKSVEANNTQQQLEMLEAEVNAERAAKLAAHREKLDALKESQSKQEELADVQSQLSLLTSEHKTLNASFVAQEIESGHQEKTLRDLRIRWDVLDAEKDRILKNKVMLQAQLSESESAREALEEAQRDLRDSFRLMKKELAVTKQDASGFWVEKKKLGQQLDAQKNLSESQGRILDKLMGEIEDMKATIAGFENKKAEKKTRNSKPDVALPQTHNSDSFSGEPVTSSSEPSASAEATSAATFAPEATSEASSTSPVVLLPPSSCPKSHAPSTPAPKNFAQGLRADGPVSRRPQRHYGRMPPPPASTTQTPPEERGLPATTPTGPRSRA